MNPECVQTGFKAIVADSGVTFGDLIGIFFISFVVSVALGPVVLALYQSRVEKLMSTQAHAPSPASPTPSPLIPPQKQQDNPKVSTDALLAAVQDGARAMNKTLLVSIGVFALLVALIGMVSEVAGDRALVDWLYSALLSTALTISVCAPLVVVGIRNRRHRTLFWIILALLLAAVAVVDIGLDESMSNMEKLTDLGAVAVVFGFLYVAVGGRRMRNVVPLLTLLGCMLFGVFFSFAFVASVFSACESAFFAPVGLLVSILGGWGLIKLTFGLLGWLTKAYGRQRFSDLQFQLGIWTINASLLFVLAVGPDDVTSIDWWPAGIPAALLLALLVYQRELRRYTPWRPAQSLLLLRVFSKRRRTQRLLDDLSFQWSFIGPIYLVGGPDLAKAYLDPHELLLFLRGYIRKIFVLNRDSLERRLTHLESRPDPDNRYRVEEFFCFEDVWQPTVARLVSLSQVVLLDLRGFDGTRQGTAFEVTLLAQQNALDRTIFLVDDETDFDALDQALVEVPGAEIPVARILQANPQLRTTDVLRALVN